MENPTNNTQPAEEEKTQDASAAQEETKGEQQENNNNNEGKLSINLNRPLMAFSLNILSSEKCRILTNCLFMLCA